MGFVRKAFRIGALLLTLYGCDNRPTNYKTPVDLTNYRALVDLNGNKFKDIVTGVANPDLRHWSHPDFDTYEFTVQISNPDSGSERKYSMRIKGRPHKIGFKDIDNDGDLDLVFSKYGKSHSNDVDYDTFAAKNDGKGNFGKPQPINK